MRGVVCINKSCCVVPIILSILDLSWAVSALNFRVFFARGNLSTLNRD